jgi:hypothetical protein
MDSSIAPKNASDTIKNSDSVSAPVAISTSDVLISVTQSDAIDASSLSPVPTSIITNENANVKPASSLLSSKNKTNKNPHNNSTTDNSIKQEKDNQTFVNNEAFSISKNEPIVNTAYASHQYHYLNQNQHSNANHNHHHQQQQHHHGNNSSVSGQHQQNSISLQHHQQQNQQSSIMPTQISLSHANQNIQQGHYGEHQTLVTTTSPIELSYIQLPQYVQQQQIQNTSFGQYQNKNINSYINHGSQQTTNTNSMIGTSQLANSIGIAQSASAGLVQPLPTNPNLMLTQIQTLPSTLPVMQQQQSQFSSTIAASNSSLSISPQQAQSPSTSQMHIPVQMMQMQTSNHVNYGYLNNELIGYTPYTLQPATTAIPSSIVSNENSINTTDLQPQNSLTASSPSLIVVNNNQLKFDLLKQLEYYFSSKNLKKDKYLLSQMDSEYYVPIITISQFPKVRDLTLDLDFIIDTIRQSTQLELDLTNTKVRSIGGYIGGSIAGAQSKYISNTTETTKPFEPSKKDEENEENQQKNLQQQQRCVLILREVATEATLEQIKELFVDKEPSCPLCFLCESAGNDSWYVTFNSEEDAQRALQYLKTEVRIFMNKPIRARIKAHANIPRSISSSLVTSGTNRTQIPTPTTPLSSTLSQQFSSNGPTLSLQLPLLNSQTQHHSSSSSSSYISLTNTSFNSSGSGNNGSGGGYNTSNSSGFISTSTTPTPTQTPTPSLPISLQMPMLTTTTLNSASAYLNPSQAYTTNSIPYTHVITGSSSSAGTSIGSASNSAGNNQFQQQIAFIQAQMPTPQTQQQFEQQQHQQSINQSSQYSNLSGSNISNSRSPYMINNMGSQFLIPIAPTSSTATSASTPIMQSIQEGNLISIQTHQPISTQVGSNTVNTNIININQAPAQSQFWLNSSQVPTLQQQSYQQSNSSSILASNQPVSKQTNQQGSNSPSNSNKAAVSFNSKSNSANNNAHSPNSTSSNSSQINQQNLNNSSSNSLKSIGKNQQSNSNESSASSLSSCGVTLVETINSSPKAKTNAENTQPQVITSPSTRGTSKGSGNNSPMTNNQQLQQQQPQQLVQIHFLNGNGGYQSNLAINSFNAYYPQQLSTSQNGNKFFNLQNINNYQQSNSQQQLIAPVNQSNNFYFNNNQIGTNSMPPNVSSHLSQSNQMNTSTGYYSQSHQLSATNNAPHQGAYIMTTSASSTPSSTNNTSISLQSSASTLNTIVAYHQYYQNAAAIAAAMSTGSLGGNVAHHTVSPGTHLNAHQTQQQHQTAQSIQYSPFTQQVPVELTASQQHGHHLTGSQVSVLSHQNSNIVSQQGTTPINFASLAPLNSTLPSLQPQQQYSFQLQTTAQLQNQQHPAVSQQGFSEISAIRTNTISPNALETNSATINSDAQISSNQFQQSPLPQQQQQSVAMSVMPSGTTLLIYNQHNQAGSIAPQSSSAHLSSQSQVTQTQQTTSQISKPSSPLLLTSASGSISTPSTSQVASNPISDISNFHQHQHSHHHHSHNSHQHFASNNTTSPHHSHSHHHTYHNTHHQHFPHQHHQKRSGGIHLNIDASRHSTHASSGSLQHHYNSTIQQQSQQPMRPSGSSMRPINKYYKNPITTNMQFNYGGANNLHQKTSQFYSKMTQGYVSPFHSNTTSNTAASVINVQNDSASPVLSSQTTSTNDNNDAVKEENLSKVCESTSLTKSELVSFESEPIVPVKKDFQGDSKDENYQEENKSEQKYIDKKQEQQLKSVKHEQRECPIDPAIILISNSASSIPNSPTIIESNSNIEESEANSTNLDMSSLLLSLNNHHHQIQNQQVQQQSQQKQNYQTNDNIKSSLDQMILNNVNLNDENQEALIISNEGNRIKETCNESSQKNNDENDCLNEVSKMEKEKYVTNQLVQAQSSSSSSISSLQNDEDVTNSLSNCWNKKLTFAEIVQKVNQTSPPVSSQQGAGLISENSPSHLQSNGSLTNGLNGTTKLKQSFTNVTQEVAINNDNEGSIIPDQTDVDIKSNSVCPQVLPSSSIFSTSPSVSTFTQPPLLQTTILAASPASPSSSPSLSVQQPSSPAKSIISTFIN